MFNDQVAEMIWQLPNSEVYLLPNEVHVWRAQLDQPQSVEDFFATLAADERERAARFRFQPDRERFIVGRGLLRAILSRYLNISPQSLSFGYGAQGKPFLVSGNSSDLRFNVSHSHGLALLAFTQGRELGIDVEQVRSKVVDEQIAVRFFAAGEVAALRALPLGQQADAFFNCWTRKEAFIKARGDGLSLPLDQFEVSLVPNEPAALLHTPFAADEAARWSMIELAPGAGFKAALVVEGRGWQLRCWQWPD